MEHEDNPIEAIDACMFSGDLLESDARRAKLAKFCNRWQRAIATREGGAIYVLVAKNDKPHPRYGIDPGGEIVHEVYTKDATRERAQANAARFSATGDVRIARLVFDETGESK